MILISLIIGVSLLLQLFLPWWIIVPVAFGLSLWRGSSARQAFLSGFIAIFVLWLAGALIPNIRNESLLATKVAEMLFIYSPVLLLVLTAFIGGLVGGLAAWSGYCWKQALEKRK